MAVARQYIQDTQINHGTSASANIKLTDVMPVQHTDVSSNVNQINKVNIAQTMCEPFAVCNSNNPANGAYTATCSNFPDFALAYSDSQGQSHDLIGMKIRVIFNYGITYGSVSGGTYPTLNINGSGTIPLLAQGKTMAKGAIIAGQTIEFTVIPYGNGLAYDADTNVREKTTDYTIYVDGTKRVDSVTTDGTDMVTSRAIYSAIDTVKNIMGALPTDAVLHYSFDEVPDYPDGTADIRLLDNNTYDIQATNYKWLDVNQHGTTFTNVNGKLQIKIQTGSDYGAQILNTYIVNKIIKLKINVTSISGTLRVKDGTGVGGSTVGEITKTGIYEYTVKHDSNPIYNNFYILTSGATSSAVFTVEQIYIGDGSYSTPIIDNANGQNNATNNGGIAVKGVSGKGAYFLEGKYAQSQYQLDVTKDFSVSLWVKPDNNTTAQAGYLIRKTNVFHLLNGEIAYQTNSLYLILWDTDDNQVSFTLESNLLPTKWSLITLIRKNNKLLYYRDSVKLKEFTINTTLRDNTNSIFTGYTTNTRPQSIDDLLIFDRALTETEVMALYLNRANTPKYYPPVALPE